MPTNDSQQTSVTPTNQTVGTSQDYEFDLGIANQEEPVSQGQDLLPATEPLQETQPESTGMAFDFSLDLPENYSLANEANAETQVQPSVDLEDDNLEQETREETPQELSFVSSEPQKKPEEALSFSEWESSSVLLEEPIEQSAEEPVEEQTEENNNEKTFFQAEQTGVSEQTSVELLTESAPFFTPIEESVSEAITTENEPSSMLSEDPISWADAAAPQLETFPQVQLASPSEPTPEQTSETPQEPIEAAKPELELSNSALEVPQTQEAGWPKLLNLDEMISHFSGGEQTASAQATMDPFSAMKATLEAQHQENPQPKEKHESQTLSNPLQQAEIQTVQKSQNQTLESWTEESKGAMEMPVQTLNLDAMIASEQPISWGLEAPVVQQTPMPESPLSNPTLSYPQLITPPKKAQGKGITVLLASILVLVIGGIAVMRYPDLLSFFQWGNTPTPTISEEQEHSSAPEQTLLTGEENNELLSGAQEEDTFESLEEITLDELSSDEEKEIPLIDLSSGEATTSNTSGDTSLPSLPENQNQNPESGTVDPLGAVEGLVGPINNNDVIKQEVLEYQQKGQSLKEQGSAQAKKTMMKYGLAVEKEATDLLNTLANGGNITISERSALKLKLDNYLQTANNA